MMIGTIILGEVVQGNLAIQCHDLLQERDFHFLRFRYMTILFFSFFDSWLLKGPPNQHYLTYFQTGGTTDLNIYTPK